MEAILELRHINKSFNSVTVLEDISFSLQPATINSFFGENGSGKSTLFHIISGFLKADRGEVLFKNNDLIGKSPVTISRLGIGRIWQMPRCCKNLSVADNLILAIKDHPGENVLNYLTQPFRVWKEEKHANDKAGSVAAQIGLIEKLHHKAGSLSFGQQKLLSIGMLFINGAEILLMDEPFAGVNPKMIDQISEVLTSLRLQGKTICMIEHNRTKVGAISDRSFLLVKGKIKELTLIA